MESSGRWSTEERGCYSLAFVGELGLDTGTGDSTPPLSGVIKVLNIIIAATDKNEKL